MYRRSLRSVIYRRKTPTGKSCKLYSTWKEMRKRCNTVTLKQYHNYGGRGIKVCSEWNDYDKFRTWAIGKGVTKNLTIDRINNNGNYEPDNCQWISRAENSRKEKLGEKNPKSKFSNKEVLKIRTRLALGEKQKYIAKDYGVGQQTISRINTGIRRCGI